jgi:adenylate cyclase
MLTMRAGTQRRVAFLVRALGWAVALGALFGAATGSGFHDAPLLGACLSGLAGSISAAVLAIAILGPEIFLPWTRLGRALERVPFLFTFAVKLLAYGTVIVLLVKGRLGWQVVGAIAAVPLGPDLTSAIYAQTAPTPTVIANAFLLTAGGIFVLQMSRLVGERTLRDIALGRYHRPRTEERFFLFVDIIGSTPLAERIGSDAVHRFLSEVFLLASDPIDDYRGDVYQYVGDEIVVTWTVTEGRDGARPVACFFAIEAALARAATEFERKFGAVPRLRAALHAGSVIAGEVGGSRRAIVYHGDVMNTTSRIENATRDLKQSFLVSEDALKRIEGKEAYIFKDLGPQQLRGREALVRVYSVELAANASASSARGKMGE